jgi:hypothetical protein
VGNFQRSSVKNQPKFNLKEKIKIKKEGQKK